MAELTDVWELIDRSIYEAIRLELVNKGYLPDITLYDQSTQQGIDDYEAAKESIRSTVGYIIDIFGAGSSYSKYEKKVPRIVYIPKRIFPGDLGGNPDYVYESNGTSYDKLVRPPTTSDAQFEISLVSNNIREERIMNAIIGQVLSTRAYIPFYTNDGSSNDQEFFTRQSGYREVPDTSYGLLEKIYMFEAKEVWGKAYEQFGTVSPLKHVEVSITNNKGDEIGNTEVGTDPE